MGHKSFLCEERSGKEIEAELRRDQDKECWDFRTRWEEVIRAGRATAKRRKVTIAASCIQDEETKNNHDETISRETPEGQRRAKRKGNESCRR